MKFLLFVAAMLLTSSFLVKAQSDKGIHFETGLSWSQIKEKALKENKYIFLDGFTTTCGPCKTMAREIFPQSTVGEFFNKNFINVAVQFDITKKDNPDVKSWYKDAAALQKTYKISSFPTYLFFNPQGELVHSLYGSSITADEFITKSKEGLDPKKQLLSLKRQFYEGNEEPAFMLVLLQSAIKNRDSKFLDELNTKYILTQKDLFTPLSLKILSLTTKKTTDPGFAVFRDNSARADAAIGKGQSVQIAKTVVFDHIILPVLRIGGQKTDYGGGMVIYSGNLNQNVDWNELKDRLDSIYPERSDEIITAGKLTYFSWAENWVELNRRIPAYLLKYPDGISKMELNSFASTILSKSDDQETLEDAITWSKTNLIGADGDTRLNCLYTCSNLLYKAGRKDEAIKLAEEAVELTGGSNTYFTSLLDQMKKGEKTW